MVSLNNTAKIHNVIKTMYVDYILLQMPAKGAKVIDAVALSGGINPRY